MPYTEANLPTFHPYIDGVGDVMRDISDDGVGVMMQELADYEGETGFMRGVDMVAKVYLLGDSKAEPMATVEKTLYDAFTQPARTIRHAFTLSTIRDLHFSTVVDRHLEDAWVPSALLQPDPDAAALELDRMTAEAIEMFDEVRPLSQAIVNYYAEIGQGFGLSAIAIEGTGYALNRIQNAWDTARGPLVKAAGTEILKQVTDEAWQAFARDAR
jgi:hypothetical protein